MSYRKPSELRHDRIAHISTTQIECFISKIEELYSSIRRVVAERLPNVVINIVLRFPALSLSASNNLKQM